MTERERIDESATGGAKIYDAAETQGGAKVYDAAETQGGAKIYDSEGGAHDPSAPRNDPNLGNILTIIVVAALLIAIVFGALILLNVF